MIAISFRFLAGRYHATPWGRHVNEGAVEWPPSPWRILRALVATWKRTLPDVAEADVRPILEMLAAKSPEFELPAASTGHTRHYMPWHKGWKPEAPDKAKTLVFDTFVAVAREPNENGDGWRPAAIIARWPNACLNDAQRQPLERILANLNTLGRSESWCEATLLESEPRPSGSGSSGEITATSGNPRVAKPLNGGAVPNDHEIVRLLCPDASAAFADDHVTDEREQTVEVVVQTRKGPKIKKRKQKVPVAVYDPNWHLCMETLRLHAQKWSDPPGSRWVQYTRRRDCFKLEPKRAANFSSRGRDRASGDSTTTIQVVRYAFDSTVLPLVTETLPVAEAARRALMSIQGRLSERDGARGRSSAFSGKDEAGRPLSGHNHAYYLPTDEDGDGRLDHLTVFARTGLADDERCALDKLHIITGRKDEERHPLRLLLLGMGTLNEYRPGPLRASQVWVSATPYIATRHAKTRGRERIDISCPETRTQFLAADVRAQIRAVRSDVAPAVGEVKIAPLLDGSAFKITGRWRTIQFKRFRSKPGDDGGRRFASAFRIVFPQPVPGPIALGHSSHFGMGLFVPEDAWNAEGERRC